MGETGAPGVQGKLTFGLFCRIFDQIQMIIPGPLGLRGLPGKVGPPGMQGERGLTGLQGKQGETGVQGIQGT